MRARHIQQMQCDARPAKSRLRGADTREVRTRIERPKGCRLTNAGPLKNRAVNQDEESVGGESLLEGSRVRGEGLGGVCYFL